VWKLARDCRFKVGVSRSGIRINEVYTPWDEIKPC